jgi:hypothetical protein
MLKPLLFSFLVGIYSISICQISIEKTDFMLLGDTARISIAGTTGIDVSITGPTAVWDYSQLVATSQKLINPKAISQGGFLVQFTFGNIAPAKYSSNYYDSFGDIPFDAVAGFLPVNIEDYSIFTKITDDSVTYPGYSLRVDGNEVPFRSDTIEIPYYFPMEFGNSHNCRAYSKIDFNPYFDGIFIQYRQRATEVDGYGTLITPYGNFNAIRVKHTITEQDSLYFDLSGFATWLPINQPTTHIYEWWAKNEKVPVLTIETRMIMGDETVTGVQYKDIYLGLDASLSENELNFSIYPNPAIDKLTISGETNIEAIRIFNVSGREVNFYSGIQSNSIEFTIDHLESGIYFCVIETNAGKQVGRFIVR